MFRGICFRRGSGFRGRHAGGVAVVAAAVMFGFAAAVPARADQPFSTYHIGNSLTWDTLPEFFGEMSAPHGLTHTVGHHIRCSKSLTYIHDNPTETCVDPTDFGRWDAALPGFAWDAVSLQLHTGAQLGTDIDAALAMIDLARSHPANADTRFVIYGPWPKTELRNIGGDYADAWLLPTDPTDPESGSRNARAYQQAVYDAVVAARPDADIVLLQTGEVLFQIDQLIKAAVAGGGDWWGFTDIDQLYRDDTHLDIDSGRWIASLAMWGAVTGIDPAGMSLPDVWASAALADDAYRDALSEVVSSHLRAAELVPEPTSLMLLGVGGLMIARRSRWRSGVAGAARRGGGR